MRQAAPSLILQRTVVGRPAGVRSARDCPHTLIDAGPGCCSSSEPPDPNGTGVLAITPQKFQDLINHESVLHEPLSLKEGLDRHIG